MKILLVFCKFIYNVTYAAQSIPRNNNNICNKVNQQEIKSALVLLGTLPYWKISSEISDELLKKKKNIKNISLNNFKMVKSTKKKQKLIKIMCSGL